MKAIITGASGTVGRALTAYLTQHGHTAVPWNRAQTPIDDYNAMECFIREQHPDVLFHLALPSVSSGRENEGWWVNYHWTGELAWICRALSVRFVYTSTVMVYSDDAIGPFTPETIPDATSGYGSDKYQAENRALFQNPDSVIARLGWQIGEAVGGNTMLDFLVNHMTQHGEIRASRRWLPACSFLPDTAGALVDLISKPAGVYLVNSNPRWSFYDIALALNTLHNGGWHITPDDSFVYDQRMLDPRVSIPSLDSRLVFPTT